MRSKSKPSSNPKIDEKKALRADQQNDSAQEAKQSSNAEGWLNSRELQPPD